MQKTLFYASIMLLMLLTTSLSAQPAEQCLTYTGNCSFSNPVFEGCFTDWIATNGTPNKAGDGFAMFLYPPEESCSPSSDFFGEGAALNNPLTGCVELSFDIKEESNPNNFQFYWVNIVALDATEFLSNTQASPFPSCQSSSWAIPPLPSQPDILLTVGASELAGGNVISVSEQIDIPAGTVQLWVRLYGKIDAPVVGSVGVSIDNFCLEECFDPCGGKESNANDCSRDDAAFILESDAIPGSFTHRRYYPVNYDLYADLNATHTWTLYSSEDPNGPFTELEVITGNTFERDLANGPVYTVIHNVNYECGTYCYGDNACGTCGKLNKDGSKACNYCGPICCDDVPPPCNTKTPTNLHCEAGKDGTIFTWGNNPDADFYEIDYYNNGSFNCNGNVTQPNETTTTNSIPKPAGLGTCYCVRVRAHYPNGCVSNWSSPFCDDGMSVACTPGGPIGGGAFIVNGPGNSVVSNNEVPLEVFPNPSTSTFNIRFNNPAEVNQQTVIRIYDLTGRIVYQESLNVQPNAITSINWQASDEIPRGVYLLKIAQAGQVNSKRLVLQ